MNSQHFIKKLFKSELHRSVLAIAIGWLLTCLFYVLLNTFLDRSLRSTLESQRGNFAKIEFYGDAQKKATNLQDYVDIIEAKQTIRTSETAVKDGLFLYGDQELESWRDTRFLLAPYMSRTTFSGGTVVDQLMGKTETGYMDPKYRLFSAYDLQEASLPARLKGIGFNELNDLNEETKQFREEVQKDLSYALAPVIEAVQHSTAYKVRRYLNGFIQFLTIWLTFTGTLIILLYHLFPALRAKKGVDRVLGVKNRIVMRDTLTSVRGNRYFEGLLHFRLFGIMEDYFQTSDQQGKDSAEEQLKHDIAEIRTEQESSGGIMRYLIWVIPSIGFIGTVIGIAQALENSHTVISDGGQLQRQAAVQDITSYLGVAFDTTLIALFASIFLYMLVQITIRYEEAFISESLARISTALHEPLGNLQPTKQTDWKAIAAYLNEQLTTEDKKQESVSTFLEFLKNQS